MLYWGDEIAVPSRPADLGTLAWSSTSRRRTTTLVQANAQLDQQGTILRQGTPIDATLVAANVAADTRREKGRPVESDARWASAADACCSATRHMLPSIRAPAWRAISR
jgi:hypothetical protein